MYSHYFFKYNRKNQGNKSNKRNRDGKRERHKGKRADEKGNIAVNSSIRYTFVLLIKLNLATPCAI